MRDDLAGVLFEPLAPLAAVGARFSAEADLRELHEFAPRLLGRFVDSAGRKLGYLQFLDRTADGRLLALQTPVWASTLATRAGVWEASSGRLVWEPPDATAMCWSPDERYVLLIREWIDLSVQHVPWLIGPLGKPRYRLELLTWPDRRSVGRCQLGSTLPDDEFVGWYDFVVVSPRGDLAAIRWVDDYNAGVVLISLTGEELEETRRPGIRARWNAIHGPVFSPDGRVLAMTCGDWRVNETDKAEDRSGWIWLYNSLNQRIWEIPLQPELPAGWSMDDWETWIGEPRFVTNTQFSISLPGGQERSYDLDEIMSERQ